MCDPGFHWDGFLMAEGDTSLVDGDLVLNLHVTEYEDTEAGPLPVYRFIMQNRGTGLQMGFINLRIREDWNLVLYRGHIGFAVEEAYRGQRYASRATRLLLPLARGHGLREVWLTCNPENSASAKSCELAGGSYVETVTVPEDTEAYRAGARIKKRFVINLLPG